jgi:hypothetical protein
VQQRERIAKLTRSGCDTTEAQVLLDLFEKTLALHTHHHNRLRGELSATEKHKSQPHDHGPTWAIYGQAVGETIMTDWEKLSPASESQTGKVKHARDYTLKPGAAYVYNEGDLHSPRRDASTKLIRIEGRNVEKIRRFPYEAVS